MNNDTAKDFCYDSKIASLFAKDILRTIGCGEFHCQI